MTFEDLPLELIDYLLDSETPIVAWRIGLSSSSRSPQPPPSERFANLHIQDDDRSPSQQNGGHHIRRPHLENDALHKLLGHPAHSILDHLEESSISILYKFLEAVDSKPAQKELPVLRDSIRNKTNLLSLHFRTNESKGSLRTDWKISRHSSLLVFTLSDSKATETETTTTTTTTESELNDLLVKAAQAAPVGLLVTDLNMKMLWANKEWYRTVGMNEGTDLNTWAEFIHPEDWEMVNEYAKRFLKHRTRNSLEFRWLPKENEPTELWTISNIDVITDDKSQPIGFTGVLTNVAKWKVDELSYLREQEAASRARLHAEQAVLALSQEKEAHARKAAEEAEKRRNEAVQEKKATELFLDVASHELRNPISAILQNAEFTKTSLEDLRGRLVRLERMSTLPEGLSRSTIDSLEEDIEACDSIIACGHAQERIANDILGLAQIQLSKYTIASIEFDLIGSLRAICRMWKNECRSKGISLELSIGTSLRRLGRHARVFADPTRLAQVLVNLLSNAVRFTAKSKVRKISLSVEVSAVAPARGGDITPPAETEYYIEKSRPVYLFFSVTDTGPGMSEEETSRLFQRFMQASPFTHSHMGGSGLGLWIARNLCELQAGGIEVKSKINEGSTFRCFITARSVDAGEKEAEADALPVIEGITEASNNTNPRLTVRDDPRSSSNTSSPEQTLLPLSDKIILCCEDNQINRTVLKKQLIKAGAREVLLAENGQEGLEMMTSARTIYCIVMDFEMPVLDGLKATQKIRALEDREQSKRIRIVGLTGNARDAQIKMGLDAGMDDVVTKPYKADDLVRRILGDDEVSGGHDVETTTKN